MDDECDCEKVPFLQYVRWLNIPLVNIHLLYRFDPHTWDCCMKYACSASVMKFHQGDAPEYSSHIIHPHYPPGGAHVVICVKGEYSCDCLNESLF